MRQGRNTVYAMTKPHFTVSLANEKEKIVGSFSLRLCSNQSLWCSASTVLLRRAIRRVFVTFGTCENPKKSLRVEIYGRRVSPLIVAALSDSQKEHVLHIDRSSATPRSTTSQHPRRPGVFNTTRKDAVSSIVRHRPSRRSR
jgi:hypothetical protein